MRKSLRERLRSATSQAHRELEAGLYWTARVATRSGYRDLLARLRGFHAAYEPAIARALNDEAFMASRRRLARLDADLGMLGMEAAEIDSLPEPRAFVIPDRLAALGALYVLEGSTLGGRVILRHVGALHGFDACSGATYYAGHGPATGAMWQAFLAELDRLSGEPQAEEAAVETAIATFAAMHRWLVPEYRQPAEGCQAALIST